MFAALEYGKPGDPRLTRRELAEIRDVLGRVKVCQRALVYYVVLNDVPAVERLKVFFKPLPEGHGYTGGHVFGSHNEVYFWYGAFGATMFTTTDREAIAEEKCA